MTEKNELIKPVDSLVAGALYGLLTDDLATGIGLGFADLFIQNSAAEEAVNHESRHL